MMLTDEIRHNLSEVLGWRTNKKIIVFESDDWGSIRMSSKDVLDYLSKKGYIAETDYYNRFDALASKDDLINLFEVILGFIDRKGNHPIFTANTIVANPDFKKIRESDFTEYHYELFINTLKKYPKHSSSFSLWKEGMENKVFHPQYHGRDHINISAWLSKLRKSDHISRLAFDNELLGLRDNTNKNNRDYYYMRALDFVSVNELEAKLEALKEGITIFNDIIGYKSRSFIAPSYVWNEDMENMLSKNGIDYLQGIRFQKKPIVNKSKLINKFHYLGSKNLYNQTYLIRNVFFEPSLNINNQVVEKTLNKIKIAFRWHKPAIIGTHRLNYIGYINESNRDKNLSLFKQLITKILRNWPDVEFMTSDKLGDLIAKNKYIN